jgi:outer membrane receptor protein involved in Fe transport
LAVFGDPLAKGWTFDIVANPVTGLRIRANVSKTRVIQSKVGADWIRFVREVRQPLWANEIEWWDDSDADGIFRPVLAWDPLLVVDADSNGVPDTVEDGDGVGYITLGDPGNPKDLSNILSGWESIPISERDDLSETETIQDYYLLMVEADKLLVAEGYEGLSNPTLREWRANATVTYSFHKEPLDNWTISGSVRYRDEQFIGAEARFVELALPDGTTRLVAADDPSKPLYGEDFWFFDAMIGYTGAITIGGSRIDIGLQLNVRNLFNEDSTYSTDASSTGRPVRISRNIPREVFLSASLRF